MGKDSIKKRNGAKFRFLKPHEYELLTWDEKGKYLQKAIEAIKRGEPLDDLPLRDLPLRDLPLPEDPH